MLLNHRSGLRNYAYFTDDKGVWDKKKTLTNQDVLTLLATKDIGLESKPGTRFGYCNTNYALLALIIEKVTNKTYPKVLQEMIFEISFELILPESIFPVFFYLHSLKQEVVF